MRSMVDAILHPAAVLRPCGDSVEFIATNCRFDQFLLDRNAEPSPGDEAQRAGWIPRIHAVAMGQEDALQFDLDYGSALGPRTYSASVARIVLPGGSGPLALFTAIDRSDASRIEKVLRRELLTDMLTALPNRAGFLEEVETRDARPQVGHAIITVDLVRFSRINESLGSIAGDEIIITVARRIKSILRAGDVLGRVGGNEFAIHSTDVSGMDDVLQIANRVRAALATPIRISSYLINVEAAVGCALANGDEDDAEELFRRAQAAVKRSKQSGAFEVYRPSTLIEAQERFNLESRLRDALAQDALHLDFQPFVSLATGEVVGFEALARWNDAELGFVSPVKFIPVAEESGLILPLGRWALRKAAEHLAHWDRQFGGRVPLTLNVNVSPVQIARDDVADAVREALLASGVDGARVTVEVTESALVTDIDKTRRLLNALKAMDLTIAMDDFGTGFSNLANLQMLPIDVLKIDRSFVNGMVDDGDKVAIVRAILSLAGALGMRTVAEGIETAEVGQALADLGCDRGQGYHYARPMSADDAFAFWRDRYKPAT
ncbi:putative bifunctional diguanylate cyclase/phosphodiesterase [Sphingobium sufflavum]|uniref:putative bifunctional diguanylate cyclase/phosphodiesterase n=1 Tax=Sphingobium sufflavum TaxID=1129547 RepID=UPI001F308E93|nr:bifunctional diguanylate cyclase/phosphodiesterase [Sphingobium sufflavum]